jgi:hypothetical protein
VAGKQKRRLLHQALLTWSTALVSQMEVSTTLVPAHPHVVTALVPRQTQSVPEPDANAGA